MKLFRDLSETILDSRMLYNHFQLVFGGQSSEPKLQLRGEPSASPYAVSFVSEAQNIPVLL